MQTTTIGAEEAVFAASVDDDGAGAIGGLIIGLAISVALWLVPLSAWFLLN